MSEKESSKRGFVWGITTAAVLLGAIYSGFQIYDRIWPKDASLVAEGSYTEIIFPDTLKGEISKLTDPPDSKEIEKILPEKMDARELIALSISRLFSENKIKSSVLTSELDRLKGYWKIELRNEGSKEAQDIKLELPEKGYYKILKIGEENSFQKFDKIIPIGSLRPYSQAELSIWSTELMFESFLEQVRITHPNGISPVNFPNKKYSGDIINTTLFYFLLTIVPFLVGGYVGERFGFTKKLESTSEGKSKEKSPPEEDEEGLNPS